VARVRVGEVEKFRTAADSGMTKRASLLGLEHSSRGPKRRPCLGGAEESSPGFTLGFWLIEACRLVLGTLIFSIGENLSGRLVGNLLFQISHSRMDCRPALRIGFRLAQNFPGHGGDVTLTAKNIVDKVKKRVPLRPVEVGMRYFFLVIP
jgi:hypothetical protein